MAKTLISRLDDENIVRAAVDPDTHEATGDVYDSVNDVSYPFGGGGGLNVPHTTLKMSISEFASKPKNFFAGTIFENNLVWDDSSPTMDVELPVGDEREFIVLYHTYGANEFRSAYIDISKIVTSSNLINCTLDEDGGAIVVTDPSADSEITVVFQGEK